jgi:molybdate transport system substrate-binding protein
MKSVFYSAIMFFAFAGCGEKRPPQKIPLPSKISISVAAAADLKFAFVEIVDEFQREYPGIQVETSYGSSGNFFAQLSNRAPFDIFFSADMGYPRKLIEQGDAVKESEFQYAVGHIGLWVLNDSPLDLDDRGIGVLNDPTVKQIAIANPRFAPYGRAAESALKHFEIYDSIKDRIVLGENITQATQFVESGAADIGIIAQSIAMAPPLRDKGKYWPLPEDSHPKLEQGGVILSWVQDREACEKLRSFVISERGQSILRRYGFERPKDGL